MNRVSLVFVFFSMTCCTMQDKQATPPKDIIRDAFPAEQSEVEKTLHDILNAAQAKDIDRLLAFIADSPKVTKFDDWELDRQDVTTWKKAERSAFSGVKAFIPAISNLRVDVFGLVAIATFVFGYDMETEREKISTKARSTFVFAKGDSGWKVVHVHNSAFKSNP